MYRILYVDDEPGLLEIGKLFLERGGQFSVDTITSAPAALALLKTKDYDAIISDYQMPEMDGIVFLKRVRTSGNTIPFILFTGRGREEVVIQALNEGADFYLQKGGEPVSQFTELAHQVRQAIQQKRAEASIRDHERREADIINFLPDATFAIDRSGTIIAWNRAIEEMTGVTAAEMLGKGDYEYAIPFYGKRRPILIDLIYEPDEVIARGYAHIVHDKDILIADTTLPCLKGKPTTLMGKASPLYNRQGGVVGAIESIRDITERKRAEDVVRESEEKFRHIFDTINDGIQINEIDPDGKPGKFLDLNIVAARMLQYTREELLELGPLDFVTGYHSRPLDTILAELASDGHSIFETEHRRKDGAIVPVEINVHVVSLQGKRVAISVARDITERKRADDAIRESEQRYRNVVEDQTEFISRFLPDGTHVFVNEAYCRYFGLKRDEVLGHVFRPTIPAEDRERVRAFFVSLTPDHPVDSIEHRIVMPDGTLRWQRWSDRAIFDPSGTITEYQSVGQDITERKLEEQALHENEQRLASIYNTVGDVIFQLAVGPHGQFRFASVNSAFSRITGLPFGQVIGRTVDEIIPGPSLSMVLEKYRQAIVEKAIVRWEETSRYPSGELIGEVSIAPIFDKAGTCTHLIGSVHDITERKRAENQVHEAFEQLTATEEELRSQYDALTTSEQTLRLSENRLMMAQEIGHIGYWEYSFETGRIWGSAEALRIYGFPSVPGSYPIGEIEACVEDRERVRQAFADFIAGRREYDIEITVNPRDGSSRRIVHSIARLEKDPGGNPLRAVGVIQDITERKQAEAALKQDDAQLRQIVDLVPHMIFAKDWNGNYLLANRAVAEGYDTTVADLVGKSQALFHKDTDELRHMLEDDREVMATGTTKFIPEESYIDASGKRRYLQTTKVPFTTLGRNQKAVLGVAIDITERKQFEEELVRKNEALNASYEEIAATGEELRVNLDELTRQEQALRESEAKFRSLVEYALEGILILDFTGRILFCNDAAARLTEADGCGGLIGRNVMEFIAPESREEVARDFARVSQGHDAYLARYNVISQKGKKISVESIGKVISFERKPADLISLRDITDRQAAETALREANRKLNILNNITRHDIRNTLFSLDVYLLELRKAVTDPELQNYIGKSIEAVKAVTHQIEFTKEYQSLGAETARWQKIGPLLPHKPAVAVRVAPELAGLEIFADPMLRKAFHNLYDNALRHGERVTEIRVRCDRTPEGLTLVWEDNGVGIPAEEKERIFERGFGKHTGLGLFLVREILGITGIAVRETGAPGHGARFEMIVPKDRCREQGEED